MNLNIEVSTAITRDEFMAFFRSETFHEFISVDDATEIFRSVLHGSSDITKELLTETASDYDVNILGLFTIQELEKESNRRRAAKIADNAVSFEILWCKEKTLWQKYQAGEYANLNSPKK